MAGFIQDLLNLLLPVTLVKAPVTGKLVALSKIPDQVFSQKLMGDGVAIEPEAGRVVAPVDGEVTKVFPTGHTIGLETANGISLLIHIGVEMDEEKDGSLFRTRVTKGDQVKAGDLLIEFDLDEAKRQLKTTLTPVIITNLSGRKILVHLGGENVIAGQDNILRIVGR